uniref:Uncharacterized protein n=1 Tax=Meloidogyne enterolobii TaxID=390850 RepID=A0A6V7TPQ1_MELEN|nr:unnamed protein product [Meloidogyne enterolobii]
MLNFTRMSHLRNLASALDTNPIRVVDNVSVALDFVERGSFILPTKQYSLAYQLSKERCDLFYFEDDHNQIPTFFIFSRHNQKLLHKWNRAIQKNQAFIRRTYDKYFFNDFNTGKIPNCIKSDGVNGGGLATSSGGVDDNYGESISRQFSSNSARDASRSLDIFATFGIFLIALLGFGLAFIAFIFELIIHSKSQRILRKWRTRRALIMGNPTMPINLMLIARGFNEARQQQQQRAYKFGVSTSLSSTVAVERNELLMIPADLLNAKKAPPRLSKTVGRSWWRHKVREGHLNKNNNSTFSNTNSCGDGGGNNSVADSWDRQRSVISALTLAAISIQNEEKQKEDKIVINEENKEEKEIELRNRKENSSKNVATQILKCGNWAVLTNRSDDVSINNADEYFDCSERKWARTAF